MGTGILAVNPQVRNVLEPISGRLEADYFVVERGDEYPVSWALLILEAQLDLAKFLHDFVAAMTIDMPASDPQPVHEQSSSLGRSTLKQPMDLGNSGRELGLSYYNVSSLSTIALMK